jgi:hypothetical protein
MSTNDGIRDRALLVRANEVLIRRSVSEAKLDLDELVVLLLDTRDAVARDLAAAVTETASALDLPPSTADVVPSCVAVIPLPAARAGFGSSHPAIANGLVPRPPPGRVRVVVVAAGGASLVHVPVSPL